MIRIILATILLFNIVAISNIYAQSSKSTLPVKKADQATKQDPNQSLDRLADHFVSQFLLCIQAAGGSEGVDFIYDVHIKQDQLNAGGTCKKDGKVLELKQP